MKWYWATWVVFSLACLCSERNLADFSAWWNIILGSSSWVLSDKCKFILCECCASSPQAMQPPACFLTTLYLLAVRKLIICLVSTEGKETKPTTQEIVGPTNLGNSWGKYNSSIIFSLRSVFRRWWKDTRSSFKSSLKWNVLCNVFKLRQSFQVFCWDFVFHVTSIPLTVCHIS